jgi:opacity protein-like surface antigen
MEANLAKRFVILMAVLLLAAAAAMAQAPTSSNVYFGWTMNHANAGFGTTGNINGWQISAEGKIAPFLGMVADLSESYGSMPVPNSVYFGGSGTTSTQSRIVTYMVGPRVSVSVGKFRPFAQVLVGGAHLHQDLSQYAAAYSWSESEVADAFGGGVDYKVFKSLAVRVQGDVLQTRFHQGHQHDERIGSGLVIRF